LAFLIDSAVYVLGFVVWSIVGVLFASSTAIFAPSTWSLLSGFTAFWIGVFYLLSFAYGVVQYTLTAIKGQTIGKMVVGIRIETEDAGLPGFSVAFVRIVMSVLGNSVFYFGSIVAAWDPDKRAFHDHLARTYVVRSR